MGEHPHKLRDNPRGWTNEFTSPPSFDKEGFQKQIDEICGKGVIRLVWGAAEETEQASSVGSLGQILERERVGRYQTRIKGTFGRVRINRWILEQYETPEQCGVDELMVRMPNGTLYVPPDIAEMRRKGRWKLVDVICDHSKCPEEICASTEYYCFGDYQEPSNFDLENLRKQTREREQHERRIIAPEELENNYAN